MGVQAKKAKKIEPKYFCRGIKYVKSFKNHNTNSNLFKRLVKREISYSIRFDFEFFQESRGYFDLNVQPQTNEIITLIKIFWTIRTM